MTDNLLNALLAMSPPANGQQPAPWYVQMFPLFLLLFAFYFALWRPQQKRAKEQANLLTTLKAGDRVTTSGGIVGVVVTVKERTVTIRSADTKLEILKTSVAGVSDKAEVEVESSPSSK